MDYVSDIVIQGFSNAITTSTRYLLQQLDPEVLARWVIPRGWLASNLTGCFWPGLSQWRLITICCCWHQFSGSHEY